MSSLNAPNPVLYQINSIILEKPVEIWAEDETRIGLLPVHRRVWAKQGERPAALVCLAYKWLYGFGFVRPQTGETY